MKIVRAEYSDLPMILKLQRFAYLSEAELHNDYSIQPLKQTLEEVEEEFKKGIFLKVIHDANPRNVLGSIRGYADQGTAFFGKLMVLPEIQNQGVGTRLLQAIETCFSEPRYELFTSSRSVKNVSLYTKNGYSEFKRAQDGSIEMVFMQKYKNA
ncbi:MAG: GNAT family N-acetyltransferase [Azovibrio sp.]